MLSRVLSQNTVRVRVCCHVCCRRIQSGLGYAVTCRIQSGSVTCAVAEYSQGYTVRVRVCCHVCCRRIQSGLEYAVTCAVAEYSQG